MKYQSKKELREELKREIENVESLQNTLRETRAAIKNKECLTELWCAECKYGYKEYNNFCGIWSFQCKKNIPCSKFEDKEEST